MIAKKNVTNWQAIAIGCLVALVASLLTFSFSVYFLPLAMKFITFVFPLSIIGALIGKQISKDWIGVVLGAVFVVAAEFFLIFAIAFLYPLD